MVMPNLKTKKRKHNMQKLVDMKTKKQHKTQHLSQHVLSVMSNRPVTPITPVTPIEKPSITHNGPVDKIIHKLTDITFSLDLKITRNALDLKTLSKIRVGVKPYTYAKELGKLENTLYHMSITKRKQFPNYERMSHTIRDNIISIKDGFARGISKYVNEKYKQEYKITNAFVKLWEIYSTFEWLIIKDKPVTKMFHMAEAPGQWINTTYTYFKQHMPASATYDWYANSLNAEHPKIKGFISALKNDYGLIKKHKDRWIWGADETGDITSPENIRWYGKFISDKFKSVDIVTGDAGLSITESGLEFLQKLEFAQMVMVACTSTPGSSCVIKHFLPYLTTHKDSKQASGFFISFMYMYQLMFKEFHMFKPLSSSPGSGEFYLVANGFLGLSDETKNTLLDALGNFKLNHAIFERRDIPNWFAAKVCGFINKLMQRNIENTMAEIELLKCVYKKPGKQSTASTPTLTPTRVSGMIDCDYYFGPKFRVVKEQELEAWLTKYKLNVKK